MNFEEEGTLLEEKEEGLTTQSCVAKRRKINRSCEGRNTLMHAQIMLWKAGAKGRRRIVGTPTMMAGSW